MTASTANSARPGLSIVVPLYDEAGGVADLVARVGDFVAAESPRRELEVILVDDGSRDGTWDALGAAIPAGDPRWRRLRHDQNRGLTAALRTGTDAARLPFVAWLDADLSYEPAILAPLVAALDEGADLATASCHMRGGRIAGVPWIRGWLSRQASRLYRLATGRRVATFTCMVRAQRRELLLATWPERQGFLGVTEQLLRALGRGAVVVEVPATLHARRSGRSKLRVARAIRAHLGLIAAARRGL
ncbi:MAG: glycosyltransferase family 2 protein [Planctomycetes bacterium]|nr:glycosyltransferase family 2 protein [Planctomycetota bacterium]